MSLIEKIFLAANAVKAGESLKDPAKWKNAQMLMLPFGIIIAAVFNFAGIELSEQNLNAINYGLATLSVLLNAYFTAATSDKVGLSNSVKNTKSGN